MTEKEKLDRLYELLPVVYRQRDVTQGQPLRALLQVIAEQVNVVEQDIGQLYKNFFIETCQDWIVPYIGDLIGYESINELGTTGDLLTPEIQRRNKILIPRREVANTIRYRRRKGTLALLEQLAYDAGGLPARAVEFYKLVSFTQRLNHLRLNRGQTVDLHNGDALEHVDGPFDELAHTVDVRRISSHRTKGKYNIANIGLYLWRSKTGSVTVAHARCLEEVGDHCYIFSVLGNDTQLYSRPVAESEPIDIASKMNLPTPIKRRAFERGVKNFYGMDKSLGILKGEPRSPIPAEDIIVANLSHWQYRPIGDNVVIDPELGRIMFPLKDLPIKGGVWVVYNHGFGAEVGGGEYDRPLSQPPEFKLYQVGEGEELKKINDALTLWKAQNPYYAVIEVMDNGEYAEPVNIHLKENQYLQIRAANRKRPIIRLLDLRADLPDSLSVSGEKNSTFILDGFLVSGRGLEIRKEVGDVFIRHTTLLPGWALRYDSDPKRPAEPSLEFYYTRANVTIEHSIIGSIQITQDEVMTDPLLIKISDSILDATSSTREAIGSPGWPMAHAVMTIVRSTVIGQVQTHAIELAEDSIFDGVIKVARRQVGCMRFCYVTPNSRTPRRYNCQPDLIEKPIWEKFYNGTISENERDRQIKSERSRVQPQFYSTRYGTPNYCRLTDSCAEEIKRGAEDQSEMGGFHNLYLPQRVENIRARLKEYTPAGMDADVIYAT